MSSQASSSMAVPSGSLKRIRLWSEEQLVDWYLDLSKTTLSNEKIRELIAAQFNRRADEIARITLLRGSVVEDFSDFYVPQAGSAIEQLVVHFSEKQPEKRAKRDRSGYSTDSSDEEAMPRHEEKKKKLYTCARCQGTFEKVDSPCVRHSGTFSLLMMESKSEIPVNDATEIDPNYQNGQNSRMEPVREWTCCGSKIRLTPGCITGTHVVDPKSDDTFDQKLVALFTSKSALEPPAIAAKTPLPSNGARPGAPIDLDDEDEDVQIIPRAAIVGNANPQGTVMLNPLIDRKKSFCLNESLQHPLESILFNLVPGVTYLESDCDAELIITVGFTSNVKLHLIRIFSHNTLQAPSNIKIFLNKAGRINFDNVSSMKFDQEFQLEESSFHDNVAIIQVQASKFTVVESVTLYISGNLGDSETTVISRLNFVGIAPNLR